MKTELNIEDYIYDLPKELIAKYPPKKRENSRLLVLNKDDKTVNDRFFHQIGDFLSRGDVLVRNVSKVIPARIYGHRANTGGKVEVLVLKLPQDGRSSPVLIKTRGHMNCNEEILLLGGKRAIYCGKKSGFNMIKFCFNNILDYMQEYGQMPLPPYIKRAHVDLDKDRYQTVYAKLPGSVAAPTAGLHFSPELIEELKNKGVEFVDLNLDVSYATFKPLSKEDLNSSTLHKEYFELSSNSAKIINQAKEAGRRIIAVGTTTVRVLESQAKNTPSGGRVKEGNGETDLFIHPPYKFSIVDALITNFHLPKSSLLFLVSAFYGRDSLLSAYYYAIREKYRFFSYGDCMLII
ncbi:MAG: tRNA preQ1(34) S-adenosylmethionine ribosyltransferase-isomerase QueA [Candidatus Saelkia tenebricola]|nr:tRNA preQ1(34) S-adenosylmethionine ribosyltransferase-isomerase QueA [Candidatus Saelkia tenebricola]